MKYDTDKNAWSFSGPGETIVDEGFWVCPPGKDDCVKVDNHHRLILRGNCMIVGGGENALDINNFGKVINEGTLIIKQAEEAQVVVKGGGILHSEGVTIIDGHIEIDGFSDQNRKNAFVSGRIYGFSATRPKIVFGRFRRPSFPHRVLWWKSIKYHAFNIIKDLARLVCGIKDGEKGPF